MHKIASLFLILSLAGCGGVSIENSSEAANHQVNAINANMSEGSGRNADSDALRPAHGQRGLMPQEPPRPGLHP